MISSRFGPKAVKSIFVPLPILFQYLNDTHKNKSKSRLCVVTDPGVGSKTDRPSFTLKQISTVLNFYFADLVEEYVFEMICII
jgi:hypothetical protein